MRIPLLVRGHGNRASSAERLLRFRNVLKSAQRTTFYRHSLNRAGLSTPQSIRDVTGVEETLPRLETWEIGSLPPRRHPRCISCTNLHNPLPGQAVITLAGGGVKGSCEILAGRFATLISFAGAVRVERALIVLTGIREGGITNHDRDWLWSVFGAPVFEQHLGLDGKVIAHECEAHEGLHIVQQNAALEEDARGALLLTSLTDVAQPALRLRTGFSASIQTGECECGAAGPRLLNLRLGR